MKMSDKLKTQFMYDKAVHLALLLIMQTSVTVYHVSLLMAITAPAILWVLFVVLTLTGWGAFLWQFRVFATHGAVVAELEAEIEQLEGETK